MKQKTQLRAKKPLKAKTTLKAKLKPKKQKKPTITLLRKKADAIFSKYVRIRDASYVDGEWIGECIDQCGRKLLVIDKDGKWRLTANIGHYITRGHLGLRYDEENCNLQSPYCNAWRDKSSMLEGYARGLDLKYGTGTAKKLEKASKQTGGLKRELLEEVIHDSKEYIEHCLTHPENYAIDN